MISYTKLKSGEWGLRSTEPLKEGHRVTVRTKAGAEKSATVGKVLWSGNGVWIASQGGGGSGSGSDSGRRDGHHCRNGHAPHPGPCCSGKHGAGYDCGADCCDLD